MNHSTPPLTAEVRQAAQRNVAQQPLLAMTGERIPVHSVLVVAVQSVAPIVAPSYWLYPEETTEASQVASAMRTYGVRLR